MIDKPNGNYGSCINKGLGVARGKYVKILDADDSFETEHFEEFVKYLTVVDADLVLSDFVIVDENRNITSVRRYGFPVGLRIEMDDICCTDSFVDMQMHAVTYKRENLASLGYRQCEGISYTDQQWIFIPMIKVRSVYNFDKYVYKYLVGRVGQTMDNKVRLRSINHLMQCMLSMIEDYNTHYCQQSSVMRKYLHARLIPQIKDIYITSFANYSEILKMQLLEFDDALNKANQDIYMLIEKTKAKFNYVGFWRRHKDIPCVLIKTIVNTYQLFF